MSKIAKYSRSLVWFRSDLRISDNPALFNAYQFSKESNIVAIYFITPTEYKAHQLSKAKLNFIMRNLEDLSLQLSKKNIKLIIEESDYGGIGDKLANVCEAEDCSVVFANSELEVDEKKRDELVGKVLNAKGITLCLFQDLCLVPPDRLKSQSGKPYVMFTPFKNSWIKHLENDMPVLFETIPTCGVTSKNSVDTELLLKHEVFQIQDESYRKTLHDLWPAGENEANRRLTDFIANLITNYKSQRDFPHLHSTSRLSPYLALGVISARTCLLAAYKANHGSLTNGDVAAWINELCWRDFYKSILYHFPRVCKNQPFQLLSKNIKWNDDSQLLNAWKEGRTGYPIVDAGMREMKATGWMHNRVRMITAMFLTKHLLIDWRLGESFFMEHLIDGDFASNNGGWQWAASTGTDAQPYFRIFNPYLQSKKFDPNGSYIRKWVSELQSVNDDDIHEPHNMKGFAKLGYVKPIVNHPEARKRAIAEFKKVYKKNEDKEQQDEVDDQ